MRYDYYYIENFVDISERKALIEKIIDNPLSKEYIDFPSKDSDKTCKVEIVPLGEIWEETERWRNKCLEINQHKFGFDLFEINRFNVCHLNTYESINQGKYNYHIDSSRSDEPSDVKLTALMNVSLEPYEGGEFSLFYRAEDHIIEPFNKPGSILIFNSWIYHRVSPVTKGKRQTLTMFLSGPLLR